MKPLNIPIEMREQKHKRKKKSPVPIHIPLFISHDTKKKKLREDCARLCKMLDHLDLDFSTQSIDLG